MHLSSLIVAACFVAVATATRYVVIKEGAAFRTIVDEEHTHNFKSRSVAVVGEYNQTLLVLGWDTMKLESNPSFSDEDQAYAAGFFEGSVTYTQAWNHYQNNFNNTPVSAAVLKFFDEHVAWLEQSIAAKNQTDPYWYQVGLQWLIWQGLFDGLNAAAVGPPFTQHMLLSLTSMGDLFDLDAALNSNSEMRTTDWRKLPKQAYMRMFAKNTHCSALYKVTGDMQDIFFGHVAWYNFNTMMRIFKHLTLNFNASGTTAKTISMSSYPGMVSSFDDYYVTDSGLSVIETSVMVLNLTMYEGNIRPNLLLYWMRTMVANRMATSAPHWTQLISKFNSGTYNNQWMVLDLNKFTPGQDLPDDTLWIAEQFPGVVGTRDVTSMLRYGYYPSYNVPMIKELFWASGYGEAVQTQGPEMNDYQMCVRAQIFRRDQGTVVDMPTFKHMMQYNDYETDPISNGNPLYAISSRADLDPHAPQCFGALDAKVSSWSMWKKGQIIDAWSGPTPQQPRFGYNTTLAKCGLHVGLPPVYDFNWVSMSP